MPTSNTSQYEPTFALCNRLRETRGIEKKTEFLHLFPINFVFVGIVGCSRTRAHLPFPPDTYRDRAQEKEQQTRTIINFGEIR